MKTSSENGFIIRLSAAIVGVAAALVLLCSSPSVEANTAAYVLGEKFTAHVAK